MAKEKKSGFGTAPVFFTAISTILGAILFLRFGFATGTLGFLGVFLIIMLSHFVTVPTALAISELATNKRVEGGGEYFIISRSFGLNVGATIGMALFLSQAISVAFYVIAFTEAFEFFFNWVSLEYNIILPRQVISVPVMFGLSILIIKKGANLGVKALYFVVGVLFIALLLFFLGKTDYSQVSNFSIFSGQMRNMDQFFIVFAIIFPAFTGMTAGVGLSGDLKKPSVSIPLGTTAATFLGMIIYFFITWKLTTSANPTDLINDQFIMAKIALYGVIIVPLGLAASTVSSALGSVMVAPRTLQALARDRSFPVKGINNWLSKERVKDQEPVNASLITCVIAMIFVALGNVNTVAEIISMFFMVTYGSLCLISFLNQFGSSPSYRPSFRSKWYFSLIGFLLSVWIMFKINTLYALVAIILMILIYIGIRSYHKNRKGLQTIFLNSLLQLSRNLQVFLQRSAKKKDRKEWRPSAICISADSFERTTAFEMLNWISYKYGFGTYLHLIEGFYSRKNHLESQEILTTLLKKYSDIENHVYVDTLISPSYTSAIAQSIQIPGISGMENNMVIFEFNKDHPLNLKEITENFGLVNSGDFDVCVIGSSLKKINRKDEIHIWIRSFDTDNANLMILLGYIMSGHPFWKKSKIRIFEVCKVSEMENVRKNIEELLITGRLPISSKTVEMIEEDEGVSIQQNISSRSANAGLTIIGFRKEVLKNKGKQTFLGYEKLGTVLFVNSVGPKIIE